MFKAWWARLFDGGPSEKVESAPPPAGLTASKKAPPSPPPKKKHIFKAPRYAMTAEQAEKARSRGGGENAPKIKKLLGVARSAESTYDSLKDLEGVAGAFRRIRSVARAELAVARGDIAGAINSGKYVAGITGGWDSKQAAWIAHEAAVEEVIALAAPSAPVPPAPKDRLGIALKFVHEGEEYDWSQVVVGDVLGNSYSSAA